MKPTPEQIAKLQKTLRDARGARRAVSDVAHRYLKKYATINTPPAKN